LSARNRSLVGHGSCSWELALFVIYFRDCYCNVSVTPGGTRPLGSPREHSAVIRSVFEATDSTRYPLQLRSQVVVHPPPRLQIMIKPYTYHTAYFPVYTYTCPLTDNRMCTSRARSVRTSTCVLRKVRCVPCACGNRGVDRRAAVRAPCGARADPRAIQ
jgi:hypothetical protein